MRLRHVGSESLDLDLPLDIVAAEITDLELVRQFIRPLLHPTSDLRRTPQRWELADLTVGGIGIRPAVDARLTTGEASLYVVGEPVPGRTPCTLEVALEATPLGEGRCRLTADHDVSVEAPLPRVARPLARRVLRHEVEKVVDHLVAEIVAHARTQPGT